MVADQDEVPVAMPVCPAAEVQVTDATATLSRAVPDIVICAAEVVTEVPTGEAIASTGGAVSGPDCCGGAKVTIVDREAVLPSAAFTSTAISLTPASRLTIPASQEPVPEALPPAPVLTFRQETVAMPEG